MMGTLGGQCVLEMHEKSKNKNKDENDDEKIPDAEKPCTSKMIIPPNNWWNMQWNNFVTLAFVVYILITPIYVSFDT